MREHEKQYWEGWTAFHDHIPLTGNPYDPTIDPHFRYEWTVGWLDAANEAMTD